MTAEGYRARLYAIEWHAELWRRYGASAEYCERMMRFCTECLDAEFYKVAQPAADDPLIASMQAYLERVFSSPHRGPQSFA